MLQIIVTGLTNWGGNESCVAVFSWTYKINCRWSEIRGRRYCCLQVMKQLFLQFWGKIPSIAMAKTNYVANGRGRQRESRNFLFLVIFVNCYIYIYQFFFHFFWSIIKENVGSWGIDFVVGIKRKRDPIRKKLFIVNSSCYTPWATETYICQYKFLINNSLTNFLLPEPVKWSNARSLFFR